MTRPAELLLEHQKLVTRERGLRENIDRVTSRLESDPEVVQREETLAEAKAAQSSTAARVRESDHEREALHEQLAAEHERIAGGVDSAIEIGVVDEKIDPAHTRSKLTQALAEAPARRGRHKNIPL